VLCRGGHLVTANPLQHSPKAKTLRNQEGKVLITDGPFAETREQIGGFLLIEAININRAVELASKIPAMPLEGIGIRPIKELKHSRGKNR
jgi:hypothetical protein